jgi:fumarate reductase subunit C
MPSSKPAHPGAMAPKTPGPTRTAAPMTPGSWPTSSRMKSYALFGMTGWVYLLFSFVAIRIVWALGSGPESYAAMQEHLAGYVPIGIHVVFLISVVFVIVRFFSLFPKAQPARIGPLKPPPAALIHAGLYAAWIGITVALSAVLAGVIF